MARILRDLTVLVLSVVIFAIPAQATIIPVTFQFDDPNWSGTASFNDTTGQPWFSAASVTAYAIADLAISDGIHTWTEDELNPDFAFAPPFGGLLVDANERAAFQIDAIDASTGAGLGALVAVTTSDELIEFSGFLVFNDTVTLVAYTASVGAAAGRQAHRGAQAELGAPMRAALPGLLLLLGACATTQLPAPSADKERAKAAYERGVDLRKKGAHEQAIREFDEALRLDPSYVEAFTDRGYSRRERKEYALAFADFDAAIRLDPSFARAHTNRGYTHYVMRDYDRAIASYDEAIRLGLTGAHFERANAFFDKGDRNRALADFSQALRNDRAAVLRFLPTIKVAGSRVNLDRSVMVYAEAIRLEPRGPDAYYGRGSMWYEWGDHARALADFAEVIRLDPQNIAAHSGAAWVLATSYDAPVRNGRRAVQFARRACDLSEWKDPYAIQTLAIAHAEANEYPEAIRWLEEALKFPDFARDAGAGARERLALFRAQKPYRYDPQKPR